jgi:hypothetical protein
MGILRGAILRWLRRYYLGVESSPVSPLYHMADMDNPQSIFVAEIENGFLLVNRKYNPNKPDTITAMYAKDPEELSQILTNRLVAARIKP